MHMSIAILYAVRSLIFDVNVRNCAILNAFNRILILQRHTQIGTSTDKTAFDARTQCTLMREYKSQDL